MEPDYNLIVTNETYNFAKSLVAKELPNLFGTQVLNDMREIIQLYEIYEKGSKVVPEGHHGDYLPAMQRHKICKNLVDSEARFLFSTMPDIKVSSRASTTSEQDKQDIDTLQSYLNNVFQSNEFTKKLLLASKDCFIGKRVALVADFDNENGGISLQFLTSLEFVYEVSGSEVEDISKLIVFYQTNNETELHKQLIYRKRYWIEEDSTCWVEEGYYDGYGKLSEQTIEPRSTGLLFIPAVVILNDSLTGDLLGSSDVENVVGYESWYSRLASGDIDALRKSMNPIKWSKDMSPESTKGLKQSAGSFWDLSTDPASPDGSSGEVGILETQMAYSEALNTTLKRMKSSAHAQLEVPDIAELQTKISSGKELKVLYWGLMSRCNEKMVTWRPALQTIVKMLIEAGKFYSIASGVYTDKLPEVEYAVEVTNIYPLPEDEVEEKEIDLAEVAAHTMSRSAYMKKWRNLTEEQIEAELSQIAKERQIIEDSFGQMF